LFKRLPFSILFDLGGFSLHSCGESGDSDTCWGGGEAEIEGVWGIRKFYEERRDGYVYYVCIYMNSS
jgi:hypothetical protein